MRILARIKLLLWVLAPIAAQAQLMMPINSEESRRPGAITFTGVSELPADQGAPFSGEQRVSTKVTLAGKTTETPSPGSGTKWWRDPQGRTRMEHPGSSIVQMCDPVEGACYVLDPRNLVAHRLKYAPKDVTIVNPLDMQDEKKRLEALGISVESFETRTVQGVDAKGYRSKVALIHESREVWFAPALGLVIRSVTTQNTAQQSVTARGVVEETFELVNLSFAAPAPELFKVPAGYTLRSDTLPFTVAVDTPR